MISTTQKLASSLVAVMALLLLTGCGEPASKLYIADAKAAGLQTDRQQLFHMIEAEDGWSGHWAGDRVEIYQYKRESRVKLDFFQAVVEAGQENNDGWVEYCQNGNMIMLAKGKNACTRLASLTPANAP